MTTPADVLVIGGGIAGIGVASHLASEAKVIVLERESSVGYHSTGRSAAMFLLNYGNATLRALSAASEPIFEDHKPLSDTPILTPRGELMIADEDGLDELETFVAEGVGLERLTAQEAAALAPVLKPGPIAGAFYDATGRDIDVDALLQGFARRARGSGAQIVIGAEVSAVARQGSVWRIETAAGAFEAPIIVNAAGAWADHVAALAGVAQIGLQPMRRSAAILPAPVGVDVDKWPMVGALDESWYFKPQSGKLIVSPADEDPVDPQDAWPDDMVLAEGLDRFEQATTFPVTRVERSWAGLRSFVPDRTPVAGFAPDADGFFWLAGQGGYGIQTAPALSQLAADLALGRTPSIAPGIVAALSPARSGIGPGVPFG